MVFTSLPVVVIGLLDQDVSRDEALRHPGLYGARQRGPRGGGGGQAGAPFRTSAVLWVLSAAYQSCACFFLPLGALGQGWSFTAKGFAPDLWSLGTACFTCVVVTVTLRAALLCASVTRFHALVLVGSLTSWCGGSLRRPRLPGAACPACDHFSWEAAGAAPPPCHPRAFIHNRTSSSRRPRSQTRPPPRRFGFLLLYSSVPADNLRALGSEFTKENAFGAIWHLLRTQAFWLTVGLAPAVALAPDVGLMALSRWLAPSDAEIVQEQAALVRRQQRRRQGKVGALCCGGGAELRGASGPASFGGGRGGGYSSASVLPYSVGERPGAAGGSSVQLGPALSSPHDGGADDEEGAPFSPAAAGAAGGFGGPGRRQRADTGFVHSSGPGRTPASKKSSLKHVSSIVERQLPAKVASAGAGAGMGTVPEERQPSELVAAAAAALQPPPPVKATVEWDENLEAFKSVAGSPVHPLSPNGLRASASRPHRVGGGGGGAYSPGSGVGKGSPPNKGFSFDNLESESYFAVQARRAGSMIANAEGELLLMGGGGGLLDDAGALTEAGGFGGAELSSSPPSSPAVSAIWANVRRSVFGPPAAASRAASPEPGGSP